MNTSQIKYLRVIRLANNIAFWLTMAMGIANLVYLIMDGEKTVGEIIFRGVQYALMLFILKLPRLIRLHFRIEVPLFLSVMIIVFCFSALVMGDGLDFYGRFNWWDCILHAESGILLSGIALWLIHIIMAENENYIYFNKYFLFLFLLMFSLGVGALWEIIEYSYDCIFNTNTQQFMATTTGSIYTDEDLPLLGHDALKDTMIDLILDFVGAFIVSVYGMINHERILNSYLNRK